MMHNNNYPTYNLIGAIWAYLLNMTWIMVKGEQAQKRLRTIALSELSKQPKSSM